MLISDGPVEFLAGPGEKLRLEGRDRVSKRGKRKSRPDILERTVSSVGEKYDTRFLSSLLRYDRFTAKPKILIHAWLRSNRREQSSLCVSLPFSLFWPPSMSRRWGRCAAASPRSNINFPVTTSRRLLPALPQRDPYGNGDRSSESSLRVETSPRGSAVLSASLPFSVTRGPLPPIPPRYINRVVKSKAFSLSRIILLSDPASRDEGGWLASDGVVMASGDTIRRKIRRVLE